VQRYAPAAAERAAQLGAHREAAAQYARALRFAAELEPAARAELLARQASECFLTRQVEVTLSAGRQAVERFREADDPLRQANAMCNLAHHLRCTGQASEADAVARRAVSLLEHASLPRGRELAMAYSSVANMCLNADDAEGTIIFGQRALVLGLVRARRGDPECWPPLDEARALAEPTGELQSIAPVAAARAEVAWLEGRPDAVRAEIAGAFERAMERRAAWIVGELALWRWRADGEAPPADAAQPYAWEMAGDWARAAAFWADRGCAYEAALALANADADTAQRRALGEPQRMGAHFTASAVWRRLRELGARGLLPRGPRAGTRSNVAGLTTRELEILELLALGLRNGEIAGRLFLSAKTVDHHVSAILGKLGVRSRTEATREAARLGVLAD
jgi:DNA-binding CsgD family transcriptional regulator